MKKLFVITVCLLVLICSGTCVYAQENTDTDELNEEAYYNRIINAVPEEIQPYIGIGENEPSEALSIDRMISVSNELLKIAVTDFLRALADLLIVILFASIMVKIKDAFSKASEVFGMIPFLLLVSYLISKLLAFTQTTQTYCEKTQSFMLVLTTSMGSVLAMGGNVIASSSMVSSVSSIVLILESVCLVMLLPVVKLSLVSMLSFSTEKNALQSLGRVSRNFFQWLIGIVAFFSLTVFGYQSIIAQAEDSVSANTLRYAVSGSIPMVGGAVGESLRTITSSLTVLRSTLGGLGVSVLLLYALVPFYSLLSFKFAVYIMEEMSDALSISSIKKLLCEARKISNMLIAVVAIVTILYIFALSVFVMLPLAYQ